ncbi:iron-containing alcohol dehydrogenase [Candidatus Woesearchaeota archaeon]|nr:iron-containing alcohol dehydrogenase [Candidatus Woesearchaeota archaeon]
MFSYSLKTKIYFGAGSFNNVGQVVKNYGVKKILVVTGRNSMQKAGFLQDLLKKLRKYDVSVFEGVEPNPSFETVEKGTKLCRDKNTELVIGLGGGSALDAAKAIAILAKNGQRIDDYMGKKGTLKKGLPFIAIPSTAGTSSEITKYSVLTDGKLRKRNLNSELMCPDYAIIDPKLTLTVGRYQTICTGLDSLCHAIESYWNVNSNPLSDLYAKGAIRLIRDNLPALAKELGNPALRENLSLACLFAGLAFGNIGTTSAHSFSYILSTKFGIPHGHACSLSLLEFTKRFKGNEKAKDIISIFGSSEGLKAFLEGFDIKWRLRDFGITTDDLDLIAREAMRNKKGRDPLDVTLKDYRDITKNIF